MVSLHLALLTLVLVTFAAGSQTSQNSNRNENANCDARLTRCERDLHDLRKQRVIAKAASRKLMFQSNRLKMEKQKLDYDILILRHQLEHPNRPVPNVGIGGTGIGQSFDGVEGLISNPNCATRLSFCERSQDAQRQYIRDIQTASAEIRSRIAEQTRVNNELKVTVASLRGQLAARRVTPHPSTQHNLNQPSSAEYDIDDDEVERRVAALVATPAPTSSSRSNRGRN
ncbi:hypothetical protein B566_EDAN000635 [Ephemera danica]|nr:hypothetical protein B566_EDAN000635 [Ephemera danica]